MKIPLANADAADLVKSLVSLICPSCGGHKCRGLSFCFRCWSQIDRIYRLPLYRRVGQGYEGSFQRACHELRVTEIVLPDPPVKAGK